MVHKRFSEGAKALETSENCHEISQTTWFEFGKEDPGNYINQFARPFEYCTRKVSVYNILQHIQRGVDIRNRSGLGFSQQETASQCNIVSHWLCRYSE